MRESGMKKTLQLNDAALFSMNYASFLISMFVSCMCVLFFENEREFYIVFLFRPNKVLENSTTNCPLNSEINKLKL